MDGYFRPLRRKLGVAALGLALPLTCLWVRSRTTDDWVRFAIAYDVFEVSSNDGVVITKVLDPPPLGTIVWWGSSNKYRDFVLDEWDPIGGPVTYVTFQHWVIAAPLTGLSAWLLLSKPKAKRPPTEPAV